MALLRRDDSDSARRTDGGSDERGSQALTLVAAGTTINGTVSGATEVLVEGVIEGRAQVESDVTIGERGLVRGDIDARSVRIAGAVVGNIAAAGRVELLAGGRIEGDVRAPRVAIAEGGFCQGHIEMTGRPEATAASAAGEAARRAAGKGTGSEG